MCLIAISFQYVPVFSVLYFPRVLNTYVGMVPQRTFYKEMEQKLCWRLRTNCLLSLKTNSSEFIVHILHSAPLDSDFSWNIKWVTTSFMGRNSSKHTRENKMRGLHLFKLQTNYYPVISFHIFHQPFLKGPSVTPW